MSKYEMTNFLIRQDVFQLLKEEPWWRSPPVEPKTEKLLGWLIEMPDSISIICTKAINKSKAEKSL